MVLARNVYSFLFTFPPRQGNFSPEGYSLCSLSLFRKQKGISLPGKTGRICSGCSLFGNGQSCRLILSNSVPPRETRRCLAMSGTGLGKFSSGRMYWEGHLAEIRTTFSHSALPVTKLLLIPSCPIPVSASPSVAASPTLTCSCS